MSGKSELHIRLVEKLIHEVRQRHSAGADIAIFADHHSFGRNRPTRIGGFFPDLFASDVPETFRVVGEAKTEADLKTDRSERQLAAFLDHLTLYPKSAFYLAVPWLLAPRARSVMKGLRVPAHDAVRVEVLPWD